MWCSLIVGTSVVFIIAILTGQMTVPFVFVVLNPLGLTLIGFLFRLIHKELFTDLPGIAMPSTGLAMMRLAAAICASGV